MALRLTAIGDLDEGHAERSASNPAAPARPAAGPTAVMELTRRAAAALAAGDALAWRVCFAEADVVCEDQDVRHHTRKVLVHAALGSTGTPARLGSVYAAVADALLAVLEQNPREPVLLNLCGIAFYELGAISAAEPLFTAALRLDRTLTRASGNLAECRRRRQAGLTRAPASVGPTVLAALRTLTARAKRVARGAVPATGLRLSLCMIVRDEEAMLARCLAAVAPAVDEIIVVDTGSVDGTVQIAESFGAHVLHHPWTGDFAAARNASFEAATGDWLLYLDADEVLVEGDAGRLRALTGHTWREAIYLVETNHTGDLDDGTAVTHDALRLFRNRPGYRFEGRIHEQIAHRLPAFLPERLEHSDVRVEHFGYLGVVRDAKDKSRRNVGLLQQQLADGDDTPFLHFNLGSEHLANGDARAALPEFAQAWTRVKDDPALATFGFGPSLAGRLVRAQRVVRAFAELDVTAAEVLARFPELTDVVFEQAHAARLQGETGRAAALLERCITMGDAPTRYSGTVGCGTHLARIALAELARDSGDLERAEALLREALALAPAYLGTVEVLARVLRARSIAGPDVVATIHAGVAAVTPSVRFLLAVALYETAAFPEAEAELRAVMAAQPNAAWARVALAETLLSQGHTAAARDIAAGVADDSPAKGAALRTESFCALADGDTSGARTLLNTDAASALEAAERAVLRAWAGEDVTPPAAAADDAVVLLDALIRLERFDAFAAVVGVFGTLPLPPRDRHERLAQLYLKRGYLESAADEWLTVCRELGADIAALRGLSTVARGHGFTEDAELFAAEADALAAV